MFTKPRNIFNSMQFPSTYTGNPPYELTRNGQSAQMGGQPMQNFGQMPQYQQPMSPFDIPGNEISITPSAPMPVNQNMPTLGGVPYHMAPHYAKGGHVKNINELTDYLRMQGEGQDKVLAHINPYEAEELHSRYGSDINPVTGLPQFGLFNRKHHEEKEQHKQERMTYDAARMRNWEQENNAKNAHMGNLANYLNSKGVTTELSLKAMKDPVLMGNLLNIVGIPQQDALTAANQGAQLPFVGTAPGAFGDEGGKKNSIFRTILKGITPGLGILGGGLLGGPLGASVGGALGGSMTRGKGNKLKGALMGGAAGLGYSMLAPSLGNAFNVVPESTLGKTLMMGSPSLMNQLGNKNAPSTGGGIGFFGNPESSNTGHSSNWLGGNQGTLDNALLATAILGALGRREKGDESTPLKHEWGPMDMPYKIKTKGRKVIKHPPDESTAEKLYFDVVNPEVEIERYSHGGYIDGHTDGQADRVPAMLSDGEFIWKAPVVAAAGGGNNNAGARILDAVQDAVMHASGRKGYLPKGRSFADILVREMKNKGIK